MIDMEYFSKAAEAEEQRRTFILQLTKMALGSSLIANQMFGKVDGKDFTAYLTGKGDAEMKRAWKKMGVPEDLFDIPADIDMVNSLRPYSQLYQQAVCKIQCVIRASRWSPLEESSPHLTKLAKPLVLLDGDGSS